LSNNRVIRDFGYTVSPRLSDAIILANCGASVLAAGWLFYRHDLAGE
jgi:hypothetical protein